MMKQLSSLYDLILTAFSHPIRHELLSNAKIMGSDGGRRALNFYLHSVKILAMTTDMMRNPIPFKSHNPGGPETIQARRDLMGNGRTVTALPEPVTLHSKGAAFHIIDLRNTCSPGRGSFCGSLGRGQENEAAGGN
ncbi:MAG TPA: hypothetical protein VJ785_00400 [Anaerolineales bacterium]|nr:hypothetical protein [Anaerolineales bacterium]